MQGTFKFMTVFIVATVLLLFYVHAEISLFRISYVISEQTHELTEKNEKFRRLKFEVDQLKAPQLLESKIHEWELDLTLPKEVRVVRVP